MAKELYTTQQIHRVLTGAGIDIEAEYGTDYIIFCPYHNNNRTPAGEVSKESGLFFCFGCQTTRSLIELIMHMTNRTYFETIRFIKSKETETDIESVINKALHNIPDFVQYDELLIKRLNKQALDSPRAMNYFESRKITKESVVKFDLGFSEKQDSVVIPMQSPDGMSIGFVARTIEGKEFKNTPGLPKSKILFNLHRVKASKTVYVVESSFDAIRLDQVGFPAVATLGANVSSSQIELLKRYFTGIVLVADNDDAGTIMSERLTEKMGNLVTIVKPDQGYKDIGDMTDDQIRKLEFQFDNVIDSMLK
ncbi:DNA primase [uncultured Caudovirales phage]|jgi:DNA primase|uniref:DNA primase n=1 Tax=uncultured Caudovirales phage TaxID=2100421 RepID=A0A6J5NF78_9CAUD|nr:DNA primase [uncultured Caudovirales phage]